MSHSRPAAPCAGRRAGLSRGLKWTTWRPPMRPPPRAETANAAGGQALARARRLRAMAGRARGRGRRRRKGTLRLVGARAEPPLSALAPPAPPSPPVARARIRLLSLKKEGMPRPVASGRSVTRVQQMHGKRR
eukprot:scaffold18992_cov113-Isochrysis_galbana.AAC.1